MTRERWLELKLMSLAHDMRAGLHAHDRRGGQHVTPHPYSRIPMSLLISIERDIRHALTISPEYVSGISEADDAAWARIVESDVCP